MAMTTFPNYTEWTDEGGYRNAIELDPETRTVVFHRWNAERGDAEKISVKHTDGHVEIRGGMATASIPFLTQDKFTGE